MAVTLQAAVALQATVVLLCLHTFVSQELYLFGEDPEATMVRAQYLMMMLLMFMQGHRQYPVHGIETRCAVQQALQAACSKCKSCTSLGV